MPKVTNNISNKKNAKNEEKVCKKLAVIKKTKKIKISSRSHLEHR